MQLYQIHITKTTEDIFSKRKLKNKRIQFKCDLQFSSKVNSKTFVTITLSGR